MIAGKLAFFCPISLDFSHIPQIERCKFNFQEFILRGTLGRDEHCSLNSKIQYFWKAPFFGKCHWFHGWQTLIHLLVNSNWKSITAVFTFSGLHWIIQIFFCWCFEKSRPLKTLEKKIPHSIFYWWSFQPWKQEVAVQCTLGCFSFDISESPPPFPLLSINAFLWYIQCKGFDEFWSIFGKLIVIVSVKKRELFRSKKT